MIHVVKPSSEVQRYALRQSHFNEAYRRIVAQLQASGRLPVPYLPGRSPDA